MIDRKIELTFDKKNKQLERYALKFRRDHSSRRFYFRYIFDFYFRKKIEAKYVNTKTQKFIDDVIIEIELKSAKPNSKSLTEIV